jgi:type 1 glutamine amidotransferase
VVLIAGDEEYRSEETLPMLAAILRRDHGYRTRLLFSLDEEGLVDPERLDHIPGTEVLSEADLLVLFTRFRALPEKQLEPILAYARSGRPIVGLRTATHAFRYPMEHPRAEALNDEWPQEVLGQRWITHHGHFDEGEAPLTEVTPIDTDHPTMRGVGSFEAFSWLYHVDGGGDSLPETATRLANGRAIKSGHGDSSRFPRTNPVTWAIERDEPGLPRRVFFTTLGHPYDFRSEDARRMLVQGVLWSLERSDSIPREGLPVVAPPGWNPTNAGFGSQRTGRTPESAIAEPDDGKQDRESPHPRRTGPGNRH